MTHGFSGDWRLAEALFQRPESIETEPPSLYAAQGENPPCAACVRVFCPGRQGQALRALRGLDGTGGAGNRCNHVQPNCNPVQCDATAVQSNATTQEKNKPGNRHERYEYKTRTGLHSYRAKGRAL